MTDATPTCLARLGRSGVSSPKAVGGNGAVRVHISDNNEIFRRGMQATLLEDPSIVIVDEASDAELAVACARTAADLPRDLPRVIVVADASAVAGACGPSVFAIVERGCVTAEQLRAVVQAAGAGLRLASASPSPAQFDDRSLSVLTLLAQGAGTLEISRALGFSERTIKAVIHATEHQLGARTRAEAVAKAVRLSLI